MSKQKAANWPWAVLVLEIILDAAVIERKMIKYTQNEEESKEEDVKIVEI